MPLSERENEYLADVLAAAGEQMKDLTDWEQGFVKDQIKRHEQYGASTFMSKKQWAVIHRIAETVGVQPAETGGADLDDEIPF